MIYYRTYWRQDRSDFPTWSDAKLRGEFDTLQIMDSVPVVLVKFKIT